MTTSLPPSSPTPPVTPAAPASPPELTGRVFRKSRGYSFVLTDRGEILCRVSNRLRKALVFPTADASSTRQGAVKARSIDVVDPVAVGDHVRLTDGGGGTGRIDEVLPRRNRFSRMIRRGRPLEQVMAANVDQACGVFAAALPDLRRDLLDRFIVQAEILGVPPTIVVTKMDLADAEEIDELERLYVGLGYPVLKTCSPEGLGIQALRERLAGRWTVMVGESGVGKTSLLNVLQPGLGKRVGEVRATRHGRGSHVTTMVEAEALDFGGWLIDTPGINDLGLFAPRDVPLRDPASYFPEFRPLLERCRFGENCTHEHEPGCAVLEALEAERIDPFRHACYLAARRELADPSVSGRE
jgi:ribosome biogenesis GTPase